MQTQPAEGIKAVAVKNRGFWSELLNNRSLYLMLLPGFLSVLIFSYGPMLGLSVALYDFDPIKGIFNSQFVGLNNFALAINDIFFQKAFINTIVIKISETCVTFSVSVILALFLNEAGKRYKSVVQTATILPYFVSWIVIASMFQNLLSPSGGLINEILINVFKFEAPVSFLSNPTTFPIVIILQDTWKMGGYFALIYLSAITSINPELYEVARVDGAGRWKQMWYVTLPCIKTTLVTMFILLTGYIVIGPYEQIFAQYSPSVYLTGDVIETYVYRLGISQYRYGLATAVGLMQSVAALAIVIIVNLYVTKTQKENIL